jgi:GTP cyclohydrolase I
MSIRSELRSMFKSFDNSSEDPRLKTARLGIEALLGVVGEEPYREGLAGTPERFVKSFLDRCEGYKTDPSSILKNATLINVLDPKFVNKCGPIRFMSTDELTLKDFSGYVTIGILPKHKTLGPAQFHGLVYCLSKRLNSSYDFPKTIIKYIEESLTPEGVCVKMEWDTPVTLSPILGEASRNRKITVISGKFPSELVDQLGGKQNVT